MVIRISDLSEEKLRPYRGLAVASKTETVRPYFIAETHTVIQNAVEAGCVPLSFLVAEKYIEGRDKDILGRFPDCPVYTAPDSILEELTGYSLTRGILCAMSRPAAPAVDTIISSAKLLVVLENVQDASNIGSIMRSACGLGADAVLLDRSCCDPLHRKAVRTSTGSVFTIPWTQSQETGSALAVRLNEAGFKTLALALTPDAVTLSSSLPGPEERVALFFGSEGNGLSGDTIRSCTEKVIIPMKNNTDSLNVGVAAAIAIWECAKNR